MHKTLASLILFCLTWPLYGQADTDATLVPVLRANAIPGYYTGALICDNAIQSLELDIAFDGDSLQVQCCIPDWAYYAPLASTLRPDRDAWRFATAYGEALVVYDSAFGEWTGTIPGRTPVTHIHLKKILRPVRPKVLEHPFSINRDGVVLEGTLFAPASASAQSPAATAILVHGRGCQPQTWSQDQGRIFAKHGLATVTFDKRGSVEGHPDCKTTTMQDHADDLLAIRTWVRARPELDVERTGLVSSSAGGWLAPFTAAMPGAEIAFIVAVVGPGTSIRQQQLDGGRFVGRLEGFSPEAQVDLDRYTELMFETAKPEKTYREMRALLDADRAEDWTVWLEETDIPQSPADIQTLWVNRWNNYDPAEDIGQFPDPYLALLGEKDDVVPLEKQITAYRAIAENSGKKNLRILVIPSVGHGMEHGSQWKELPYNRTMGSRPNYYKFDRVAYGAVDGILEFLKDFDILER